MRGEILDFKETAVCSIVQDDGTNGEFSASIRPDEWMPAIPAMVLGLQKGELSGIPYCPEQSSGSWNS